MLACYWRDKGLLRLEEAVHKMTGMSARRFHIGERGELRVGFMADVVVFDPERGVGQGTFEARKQFSDGIEQVWVNEVLSYTAAGRATGGGQGGSFGGLASQQLRSGSVIELASGAGIACEGCYENY